MSERNCQDHWDSLVDNLGAVPKNPSEAERTAGSGRPTEPHRPKKGKSPPAARPPRPAVTDWTNVAQELGLAMPLPLTPGAFGPPGADDDRRRPFVDRRRSDADQSPPARRGVAATGADALPEIRSDEPGAAEAGRVESFASPPAAADDSGESEEPATADWLDEVEGESDGDGDGEDELEVKPRRRRRRRGRSKRDATTGEANMTESDSPETARRPRVEGEPRRRRAEGDSEESKEPASRADSTDHEGDEPAGESRRPRRRKRRRRSKSDEATATVAGPVVDEYSRDLVDDDDDDDDDELLDTNNESGDDEPTSRTRDHRNIPSWAEAIGVIVDKNLDSRSRGGGSRSRRRRS